MYRFILVFFSFVYLFSFNLEAFPYQTFKNHWSLDNFEPKKTDSEYFNAGMKLLEEEKYRKALPCFFMITHHFKNSIYYQDSLLAIGRCFFLLHQYDLANTALSKYLTKSPSKENFELTLSLKYTIAEKYAQGYRKHIYGIEGLPRLEDSTLDAYEIYDEIYSMVNDKDISAKSLFFKASLLKKNKSLDEALKTFQDFTKQFSHHPLCLKAFIEISDIYLQQSLAESDNTSYLTLALLNQEQVKTRFPVCEELTAIDTNINKMKEHFSLNLFKTGLFYQKKKKYKAAKIYFEASCLNYPNTCAAKESQKKLQSLKLSNA